MSAVLEFPTAKATTAPAERRYVPPSIAGDYTELTDKQKRLLAIASDLGRNKFAPRRDASAVSHAVMPMRLTGSSR